MGPFGKGLARVCAVVAAPGAVEMAAQVRAALRETSTIELRIDWLSAMPNALVFSLGCGTST